MKAAQASFDFNVDHRVAQLGRSVRRGSAIPAPWSPPPLTDLIGRIDAALRDRAAL